jgi:predicted metalloprotease with PDZ domain
MKKALLLLLTIICISSQTQAQQYTYTLDALNISKDKIAVECFTPPVSQASIVYHFPKVVPGTYAIEDYGKYIEGFKAFDKNGASLSVSKQGNNDFVISNATQLHKITYLVNDAMDKRVKKNKIFEPASTNIEVNSNVVINNGGFFGYLDGTEKTPINLNIKKPSGFFAATSLPQVSFADQLQVFKAASYHQLVDCPMLLAKPDTAMFYVNNTLVTIACFDKSGKPRAKFFYNELKRDMQGIAQFLPKLPVDNYTFLVYVDDFVKYGPIIDQQRKPRITEIIPLIRKFAKLGVGALEHGNSSFYYLANFGDNIKTKDMQLANQMTGAAIHEFMHIITPLGLHSQHIGDFNYATPIMSKHLWLYEGCTEYFANLIKLQAGIYTKEKFLEEMKGKIVSAQTYPWQTMSFTKMSANCLEKTYNKQYIHVYDRGAVYAMLLDARIIKLSNGTKTLKDVILGFNQKYGKDKSFEESELFTDFEKEVPGLKSFFDEVIDGNNDYDINKELAAIGIEFQEETYIDAPRNPLNDSLNDITKKTGPLPTVSKQKVESVGSKEWAGLQKGDKVSPKAYYEAFKPEGVFVKEGETVNYKITRNKKEISLPVKVVYAMQLTYDYLAPVANPTEQQKLFWKKYMGQ